MVAIAKALEVSVRGLFGGGEVKKCCRITLLLCEVRHLKLSMYHYI